MLTGLSPRLRGNRRRQLKDRVHRGSIPALTGKPTGLPRLPVQVRVYPRAYGETAAAREADVQRQGLSPRLRGNHSKPAGGKSGKRSIPALTGKPAPALRGARRSEVYPRAYGETQKLIQDNISNTGLSPRLRGNQILGAVLPAPRGSIPALTGKPPASQPAHGLRRVYPRAYGETRDTSVPLLAVMGLSPRLRGNPHTSRRHPDEVGSIPALTGKPHSGKLSVEEWQVYPRAYGETVPAFLRREVHGGLSPRLRGNQQQLLPQPFRLGSIPALTGKPVSTAMMSRQLGVYPRAYGETATYVSFPMGAMGLSPRLRGNQRTAGFPIRWSRSIPALTGKPTPRFSVFPPPRVYPRAYGETPAMRAPPTSQGGLSPRLRGNRHGHLRRADDQGSIPALTGKPCYAYCPTCCDRVYPRAYGETDTRDRLPWSGGGLSPRLRGNPELWVAFILHRRSIPALTGKPPVGSRAAC